MEEVAPLIAEPSRFHWYEIGPKPSTSARLLDAVKTSPCSDVPLMVSVPVGESLTLATADVALDVTLSAVP